MLGALIAEELGGDKFLDPDGREDISDDLMLVVQEILKGIKKEKKEIDRIISSCLHNRDLHDLGLVEKSVLRLATYELFFNQTSPKKVIISEGVVLAKKYAGDRAAKFVNGVLGGLYNACQAFEKNTN